MRTTSKSVLYGYGVFSTIRILNGTPFLWDKHWRRLVDNAGKIGIDLSEHTEENTKGKLDEIIANENISNGRARITFADDSPSEIWTNGDERKTSLSILTSKPRPVPDKFRLKISRHPVNSLSPLAGIKSCNYLEKLLILDEAKTRGFDEAVQINERGEITSGTMANVFWLKDDVFYTPSIKTGCLPGTTREFVMENLDCQEVEVAMDELNSADAIFLTSAGLGVVQVTEFESREFEKIEHPLLQLLPKQI